MLKKFTRKKTTKKTNCQNNGRSEWRKNANTTKSKPWLGKKKKNSEKRCKCSVKQPSGYKRTGVDCWQGEKAKKHAKRTRKRIRKRSDVKIKYIENDEFK